jgi:hypothetical protein
MEYHFPKALEETNNNESKSDRLLEWTIKKKNDYNQKSRSFYRRKNIFKILKKISMESIHGKTKYFRLGWNCLFRKNI